MKSCPYCGSLPHLAVRVAQRDIRNRPMTFWYQYNCENKRCIKKPQSMFSSNEEEAEAYWDNDTYIASKIK